MKLVWLSALMTLLVATYLIACGYFWALAVWLGSAYGLALFGWWATLVIRPRYPVWWERHIAMSIDKDLMVL